MGCIIYLAYLYEVVFFVGIFISILHSFVVVPEAISYSYKDSSSSCRIFDASLCATPLNHTHSLASSFIF